MASSLRRFTNSRRAQFSVFSGYVLATIGALVGAVLLALSLWNPSGSSGAQGAVRDVTRPLGRAGAQIRISIENGAENIAAFWYAGSKNRALKQEVDLARIRLAETEALKAENARLKALNGLMGEDVKPVVVGRLIGSSASSIRRFAYLDAGRSQGVMAGMPVRSERGVVGRVLDVSNSTARVMLLTDSQSVVPIRLAGKNIVAFAEGRGDGILQVRLFNLGINPLKKGDVMVTSGTGGFYRAGIAVAIVTEINRDGALARVISDSASTNYVIVEPVSQPELVKKASEDEGNASGTGSGNSGTSGNSGSAEPSGSSGASGSSGQSSGSQSQQQSGQTGAATANEGNGANATGANVIGANVGNPRNRAGPGNGAPASSVASSSGGSSNASNSTNLSNSSSASRSGGSATSSTTTAAGAEAR